MEFVPYAFCEKVVGILAEPSLRNGLATAFGNGLESPFWQRAVQNEVRDRRCFRCYIEYRDAWTVRISRYGNPAEEISLEEFFNPKTRHHHHIVYVTVGLGGSATRLPYEEAKKLLRRTIPYVNMAHLSLRRTAHQLTAPVEHFAELVSFFESSTFHSISFTSDPMIASYEAVLMKQMKTESMKWILLDKESTIPTAISSGFSSQPQEDNF